MSSISTTSPTLCAFITFITSLTLLISLPPKRVMISPDRIPAWAAWLFCITPVTSTPCSTGSLYYATICGLRSTALILIHGRTISPFSISCLATHMAGSIAMANPIPWTGCTCIYVSCMSLTSLTLTTLGITFSTAATIVSSKLAICITSPGKVKCASRCYAFGTFCSRVIAAAQEGQLTWSMLTHRIEELRQSDNLSYALLALLRFVSRIHYINCDSLKKRAKKRLAKLSLKWGIYEKMWIEIVVAFKHRQCLGCCELSNELRISCVTF